LEDRTEYFERMLADNLGNPTGLLALANEYNKAERYEDEAAVLERYVATHVHERSDRQRLHWLRFSAPLTGDTTHEVNLTRA
jgi:hypothetical protein